jgi:hypothetical protein
MADERLSAAAKCVATVLLLQFRNHKTSVCNPSFTTIAQCVGRKRRSVIDAINELKDLGWMDWEGTAGGSPTNTNNFQFYLKPRPVQQTAPVQDTAPVQSSALTGAADPSVQRHSDALAVRLPWSALSSNSSGASPIRRNHGLRVWWPPPGRAGRVFSFGAPGRARQ